MDFCTYLLVCGLLGMAHSLAPDVDVGQLGKVSAVQFNAADFLTSFATHSAQGDVCVNTILHMVNNIVSEASSWSEIITYSGRGLNDLGDYLSCKKLPDKYYLLSSIVLGSFSMHLGLCLPNNCSYTYMLSKKDHIRQAISSVIGTPLGPDGFLFTDPAAVKTELSKVTVGAGIVLGVIGLLVFVVVLASAMDYNEFFSKGRKGTISRLLWCFSLKRNIKGLLTIANRVDPNLEVLNGIRVLAIGWVVLGHSFYIATLSPFINLDDTFSDLFNAFFLSIIKCATVAVDVFLYLSGFLAGVSFYRSFQNPRQRTIGSLLLCYFHRYMRLMPFLVMLMLYTMHLQPLITDGPLSYVARNFAANCANQWYEVLLYYVNFTSPFKKICNGWTWYLYVDMQLFLFAPIIMLIYNLRRKIAHFFVAGLTILSFIIPTILCWYYGFNLSFSKMENNTKYDSYTTIYIKPYCRASSYYLGLVLFILYNEGCMNEEEGSVSAAIKNAVYTKRWLRYLLYASGVAVMGLVTYSFYFLDAYPHMWNAAFGVVHMVFARPLFVIGLALVIYPVIIGRGKNLLGIFGHYVFNPMGKLTYGVYIVHLAVFFGLWMNILSAESYTIFDRIVAAVMMFVLSYVLSFAFTLVLDSPVVQLLKMLTGKGKTDKITAKHEKIKATKEIS